MGWLFNQVLTLFMVWGAAAKGHAFVEGILSFVGDVYQWDVCFVHLVED